MDLLAKFTPERVQRLLTAVQSGIMLITAGQLAGIPWKLLQAWLQATDEKFVEFQEQVLMAQGTARALAEMEVFKKDPKFWLLCGPGRERYHPDGTVAEEGWARPATRPTPKHRQACRCCGYVSGHPLPALDPRADGNVELRQQMLSDEHEAWRRSSGVAAFDEDVARKKDYVYPPWAPPPRPEGEKNAPPKPRPKPRRIEIQNGNEVLVY
jgi:hypothetical protein